MSRRKSRPVDDVPPMVNTNIHDIYRCIRSWHQCEGHDMRIVYETDTHITLQCMGCRLVQRHEKVVKHAETD